MIDKNKTYECEITDLTVNGDGVAKINAYPLFIKGAIPGDKLIIKPTKLNKTYGFAKVVKLLNSSLQRRNPPCSAFSKCGGCLLMHQNYQGQLKFKSDFVLSNILKFGGFSTDDFLYEEIIPCDNEFNYRNKAQFPVRYDGKKIVCGFYEPKSHSVIDCTDCYIQNSVINEAVEKTLFFVKENKIEAYNEETHTGVLRHIYIRYSQENKELMVVLVTNSKKKIKNVSYLVNMLSPLGLKSLVQNINTKKTNVVLGDEDIILWGEEHIIMQADDLKFKVSPKSFFQVNTPQMKKLYKKALEYAALNGSQTVFDLYCGVGSISLYMAKKAKKVIGVEIVPSAIENAKENMNLNGIKNAEFYCGDCTEVVENLISKGEKADVVVIDPPRKGCDEKLLNLINNISPKKIVYVSCNSATLGRDLKILKAFGYKPHKACAVDLFPQSTHCESIALLVQTDSAI